MAQTLLTLLALALVILFSYNQYRGVISTREYHLRHEIASQAVGVAVDQLEAYEAFAFDETILTDTLLQATDLTAMDENGFQADTPNNDLDDFDRTTTTTSRLTKLDTLWFSAETQVTYLEEADPGVETTTPSKFKKATVTVYPLDVDLPDTIRLSQVYNCGSRCTW
jgi:hypothetical protein